MKLQKKEKVFVYVAITVVALVVLERVFFAGLRAKVAESFQKMKDEEVNLKAGLNIELRKDRITSDYRRYQVYLDAGAAGSDRELATRFLKEVEKIAKDAGVSITSLTPTAQQEEVGPGKRYTAELRAEAPLDKVLTFLSMVEKSTLLIKVDRLSLLAKDEEASALKIETRISIVAP